MPKKKYYTTQEIVENYNITEDQLKSYFKKGLIKSVFIKGELLIPSKGLPEDILDLYHSPLKPKIKRSLVDEIRGGLVQLIVVIIIPTIALVLYIKIVGSNYLSTETGMLLGMGIVLISALFSYIGYNILFPKYTNDLPDKFF